MNIYLIILIMLIAGILGGSVNYRLSHQEKFNRTNLFWSIVIGIAASMLVPLFLNTISSSMLTNIQSAKILGQDILVFFGFCLLAAISSRSMINTLTDKILKTAEKAIDKAETLEQNISSVLIKETEPDSDFENNIEDMLASSEPSVKSICLNGIEPPKIINALGNSKYSRRTVKGISKEAGVPIEKTVELLEWLQKKGLAFTTGAPENYWSLTMEGRNSFSSNIKDNS